VQPPVLILSDEHIGSYAVIGDLLSMTLQAAGIPVQHRRLTAARSSRLGNADTVIIHNTIGPRFEPIKGRRNIALVHHEWDRYPRAWVESLNRFSEVWVTTTFVKRTLTRSGVVVPMDVVRPALDLDPVPVKTSYRLSKPLRVFACGAPHFRKGFHLLIEGLSRAFPKTGQAELVIHTQRGGEWSGVPSNVTIDDAPLSREGLLARYRGCDLFVSASLGEGLGLPVAEAILAGVPVLTHDWGGHKDLLRRDAFFRMPYAVSPQPYCSRPDYFAPGQRCAIPDIDGIAAALRLAATSDASARKRMAGRAREWLLGRYGQRAVLERLRSGRQLMSLRRNP
jgi:glycosyltransferase involved in cell wall biosynthesis